MRIGVNPNKNNKLERNEAFHQIVIPVFIPNQEDYFKESFTILKLHFESLFKTIHSQTFVSVINNGCCKEVKEYLDNLYVQNQINEIIHTDNIGKINAILKGIIGHSFQYITLADCDVLFQSNWQNATYEVFNTFKKAGVVGLTPTIKTNYILTANVLFENVFSKKMSFSKIHDEEAMMMFYKSVGNEEKFRDEKNKRYYILEKENVKACVGSGHYVATYQSDIFRVLQKSSQFKMAGDLKKHFDDRLLNYGLWRLTTLANYAYHMGNNPEQWMYEKVNAITKNDAIIQVKQHPIPKKQSFFSSFFTYTLPSKVFKIIKFRRIFETFKRNDNV